MNLKGLRSPMLALAILTAQYIFFLTGSAQGGSVTPAVAAFSGNVRVNSGGTPYDWQVEPTMVVGENGVIYAGWKEAFTDTGGGQRVAFSRSTDGGESWSSNILMATSNPGTLASDPWLIKDGMGKIHYIRLEYNQARTVSGVTVSNSTDGLIWASTNYMDDVPNFADKETVCADATGNLYMAYNSNTVVNDMRFRKSADGGATWTPRVRVPDSVGDVIGAYIVRDAAGRIFVSWADFFNGNIMIDSSVDNGSTWGTDIRVNDIPGSILDPLPTNWNLSMPAVALDSSDNLYVIWTDYRLTDSYGDIYSSRSTNHGATWSPAVKVNDDLGPAGQRMADITMDTSGVLHAAWYDHRNGGYDVYYSNSSDGGQTWSANLRVSTVTTSRFYERPGDYITIRSNPVDGNVYIIWTDGRGSDFDIYFAALMEPTSTQWINTDPSGLEILIDGLQYTAPQMRNWGLGETHVIGTLDNQIVAFGTRYALDFWSDGGPITHTVFITGSTNYTATFMLQHHLNVTSPYGTTTGGGWYDYGTVTGGCVDSNLVQQTVDTRHRLTGWGGDAIGNGFCTDPVTMDAPKNATALWRKQFLVNGTSPHGSITGGGWYDDGNSTSLALTIGFVQIDVGERAWFNRWTGDANGTGLTSDLFIVDAPKNAVAAWRTQFLVTATSPHGTITGDGWHDEGNSTSLALSLGFVPISAGERAQFTMWTGAASGTGLTSNAIVVDSPKVASAQWRTEYLLTVVSAYGSPTGGGWYSAGTSAPVSIESPASGTTGTRYVFTGWTGAITSANPTASVIMSGPSMVIANWKIEHFVDVVSDHGVVNGTGWYEEGSVANISAPDEVVDQNGTWRFKNWSGGFSSTNQSAGVLVDGPKVIWANWEQVLSIHPPEVEVNLLWYLIVAVLVALLILVLVIWLKRRKKDEDPPSPEDKAMKP